MRTLRIDTEDGNNIALKITGWEQREFFLVPDAEGHLHVPDNAIMGSFTDSCSSDAFKAAEAIYVISLRTSHPKYPMIIAKKTVTPMKPGGTPDIPGGALQTTHETLMIDSTEVQSWVRLALAACRSNLVPRQ